MEAYAELLANQGLYQDIYNANRRAYKTAKQREEKRRVRVLKAQRKADALNRLVK